MPLVSQHLLALLDRLVRFHFVARAASLSMLADFGLNTGERAMLVDIDRTETPTVAEMAHARSVSRQAIQKIVDGLRARGLVEALPHPTDQRTRLLRLTPGGESLLKGILDREAELVAPYCAMIDVSQVDAVHRILDTLETGLVHAAGRKTDLRRETVLDHRPPTKSKR